LSKNRSFRSTTTFWKYYP